MAAHLARALVDVVLPGECPGCRGPAGLGAPDGLCPACEAALPALPRFVDPPPFVAAAWTLGDYEGPLGAAVRRGKYGPDPALVAGLGRRLADAARFRLPPVDLVTWVPVPLPRLLRRGFDQARLLAAPVAGALNVPARSTLRRVRRGEQAGRTARERWREGGRAWRLAARRLPRRVLLVDDVTTTGATASACAAELLAGGAERVYLLTACAARRGSRPSDDRFPDIV